MAGRNACGAGFGVARVGGLLFAALAMAWGGAAVGAETTVTPLARAHSHNDYEHDRPLLDALDQGFCSVEADVYLVDDRLLVAHDRPKVKPERTLEALYLDPLMARVRAHGGRVYRNGPDFYLLVDFKSEGAATWPVLKRVLGGYTNMLTRFTAGSTETNAVTVVVSGDSPRELMAAETLRYAGVDGRLRDLDGEGSRHLVPWISDHWGTRFTWRGSGLMPSEERTALRRMVDSAHRSGRKVRFWGGADVEAVWREQFEAGVDLINTDRLAELRRFLSDR